MNDVMIDLETMGNTPNAAIVAIGAVAFDRDAGTLGPKFYTGVSLVSSVQHGMTMDPDTVLWWLRQGDEARAAAAAGLHELPSALAAFTRWVALHVSEPANARIWGNGAAFDNVILASAYRLCKMPAPWNFWNDRCYRTLKAKHPGVKPVRTGTHHNALDDAITQANHLMAIDRFELEQALGRSPV